MLVGEAEVADIVRAVHRLLQRAQHHRLQQLEVRPLLDLFEQDTVILGRRIISPTKRQTEFAEEAAQVLQFLVARRLMDAIQAGLLVLGEEIRGTDVGRQHALLDDPMRIVANDRHDILDLALFVEQHLRFGRLEIYRPALPARLVQGLEQLVEVFDVRLQRDMNL